MYDYNYKVGESSYQDMLAYLDRKQGRSAASPPPGRKSFAERFAEKPFYGDVRSLGSAAGGGGADREAPLRPRFTAEDTETEELLRLRPRPALDPSLDLDPEALVAEVRRGAQHGWADVSGAEHAAEELGSRTRRALRQIDEELAAMGIRMETGGGAAAATEAVAEADASAKSSSVQQVASSSVKKVASSAKRSVTYAE